MTLGWGAAGAGSGVGDERVYRPNARAKVEDEAALEPLDALTERLASAALAAADCAISRRPGLVALTML